MALDNLISVSFTEDELARIDRALMKMETIIKDKALQNSIEN
jgi:hypothetical protein